MKEQILIISFWNPNPISPGLGIFIHEQVNAISDIRNDILFLEINILPHKNNLFQLKSKKDRLGLNDHLMITIHSVIYKIIYLNPWFVYYVISGILKKEFPSLKVKLIHSNIIFPCGIIGYWFSKKYKCNHIISEHWSKVDKLLHHPIYSRIALKAYKKSKKIICVSGFLANKVIDNTGIRNIRIIPNIIDNKLFRFLPKSSISEQFTFTCIAKWDKPKRLDLIIDSIIKFSENSDKKIILNIVGNGSQRDTYMDTCQNNLQFNWLGHLPKEQLSNLLNKTDYFLHASEIETFSIVTVEALATGTPVLASNVGALPELINEHNGILVENNVDAWLEGIEKITSKIYDHAVIARQISDNYSPGSIANMISDVYKNTI